MRSHPGGDAHSRRMIGLAALPLGSKVLDLGAGAGETVALLRSMGYEARGIDLSPRGEGVEKGDLLAAPFPDGSFDAVISQCSFFISGDQPGALREARRLLRRGGLLLLGDVFFSPPLELLEEVRFELIHVEDMTPQWREYYLEALWRDEPPCCEHVKGKARYFSLIGRKV